MIEPKHISVAARLKHQRRSNIVVVLFKIVLFLHHGVAGHIRNAADYNASGLTHCVRINRINAFLQISFTVASPVCYLLASKSFLDFLFLTMLLIIIPTETTAPTYPEMPYMKLMSVDSGKKIRAYHTDDCKRQDAHSVLGGFFVLLRSCRRSPMP